MKSKKILGLGPPKFLGANSSSFISAGRLFQPHRRTSGGLELEVESTAVTHSSEDWWDILLPLAWHRHQIEGTNSFYCLIRKTLAMRGKRNCQSSEEKSFYRNGTRTIERPVAGRRPNPLGHRSPPQELSMIWQKLNKCHITWFLRINQPIIFEPTNACVFRMSVLGDFFQASSPSNVKDGICVIIQSQTVLV